MKEDVKKELEAIKAVADKKKAQELPPNKKKRQERQTKRHNDKGR